MSAVDIDEREAKMRVLTDKLHLGGIDNATDLFQLSPLEVMMRCDMSYADVIDIQRAVAVNIASSKRLGHINRNLLTLKELPHIIRHIQVRHWICIAYSSIKSLQI